MIDIFIKPRNRAPLPTAMQTFSIALSFGEYTTLRPVIEDSVSIPAG
jgi:hypothetical protein